MGHFRWQRVSLLLEVPKLMLDDKLVMLTKKFMHLHKGWGYSQT